MCVTGRHCIFMDSNGKPETYCFRAVLSILPPFRHSCARRRHPGVFPKKTVFPAAGFRAMLAPRPGAFLEKQKSMKCSAASEHTSTISRPCGGVDWDVGGRTGCMGGRPCQGRAHAAFPLRSCGVGIDQRRRGGGGAYSHLRPLALVEEVEFRSASATSRPARPAENTPGRHPNITSSRPFLGLPRRWPSETPDIDISDCVPRPELAARTGGFSGP